MNGFALYLDEDSSDGDLVDALRSRRVDVITVSEAGLAEQSDEEQLLWATDQGRSIYTFNAKHFYHLRTLFLETRRNHAGIIIGQQQRFSIGEQLRRLLRIIHARTPEEMRNCVEFLSNWR